MATHRPRVGQPAWVANDAEGAVYALGQVTGQKCEACEVQLAGAAKPIQVPTASCWPVNEPGSHALHDLTELHFVHEAALLAHVRERYSRGSIYTYVGPTLVSLNPFRELPGEYGQEACRNDQQCSYAVPAHPQGTACLLWTVCHTQAKRSGLLPVPRRKANQRKASRL